MKTNSLHRLVSASALALAVGFALTPCDAHARSRSTKAQGPRGGTAQRDVTRTPGNLAVAGSATLPNGKTATRTLNSQKTETGRATSVRATGFNGATATYDSATTKTNTGFNRTATATGPQGATATKEVSVTTQGGTTTRTVTTTATPPKS